MLIFLASINNRLISGTFFFVQDKQQVQAYRARIRDKIGRKNEIRGQPRQSYVQTQSQSIPNIPPSNLTPVTLRPLPKSCIITPSMSLNTDWTPSGVTNHQDPQTYILPQGLVTLAPLDLLTQPPSRPSHNRRSSPIFPTPTDPLPNAPYDLYSSEYDPLPGPYNTGLQSRVVRHTPSPVQLSDFSTVRPIQQRHSDPQPISSQTSGLVLYFFEHVKGLLKFHSNSNDITFFIYSVSLLFLPPFFDLRPVASFSAKPSWDHHSARP